MTYNRKEIAESIYKRLEEDKISLQEQFLTTKNKIPFFYIDDLLPEQLAKDIFSNFPKITDAVQKKNIREYKYTAYQMNQYKSLLEEVIYAFQEENVVRKIGEICSLPSVLPDANLYAGGLSLMEQGNFLNPHLDNSHDKDRKLWRVLNLLYYVTPDWKLENGGNLELWQNGLQQEQTTVESKFNRLVVMATHQKSWHSVSKVKVSEVRCAVSNYYFSETPFLSSDAFHVTTFRGLPQEKVKDVILQADNLLRSFIRKIFRKGIRENPHQYKK